MGSSKSQLNALKRLASKLSRRTKVERPRPPEVDFFDRPRIKTAVRVFEIAGLLTGLVGLWVAGLGLYYSGEQTRLAAESNNEQRQANAAALQVALDALKDQRIASGWQILAQPGVGSSGKGYALEIVVNEARQDLWGLNLGCKQGPFQPVQQPATRYARLDEGNSDWIDQWLDLDNGVACEFGTVLSGIQLQGQVVEAVSEPFQTQAIYRATFAGANLSAATISDLSFRSVNFAGADLRETTFTNVDFADVVFGNGDETATRFAGQAERPVVFNDVVFLGARFDDFLMANARLENVIFDRSDLWGTFRNVQFGITSLANSTLAATTFEGKTRGSPADFTSGDGLINVSGTRFCQISESEEPDVPDFTICAVGLDQTFFDRAWYFKDTPPLGLFEYPGTFNIMAGCERSESTGVASLYPNTLNCDNTLIPLSSFPDDEGYP